ncbi:poly-gamma-glutamate synthesis protein (capsule biosynthesis protein) [Paenibacillus sp. UNC496MF]|uniref:CapA family protein n=1 Tax=Paenibacillus sp. UNC496MF TaxID=1502753 RepID=UPI0008F25AD0|nr:CapA family protein [Paenibacillus sp. UNC496MF]SFI93709.1 poly-gamma-glutamate synthesis protein (capsule biosynthesis protein) [Paenibacillus sp. UNC496MF]
MVMSRSESHQRRKRERSKRLRRLAVVNFVLLLAVGALAVVYALQRGDGGSGTPDKPDAAANANGGSADAGKGAGDAPAANGEGSQDGQSGQQAGDAGGTPSAGQAQDGAGGADAANGGEGGGNAAGGDGPGSGGKPDGGSPADGAAGTAAPGSGGSGAPAEAGVGAGSGADAANLSFTGDILLAASVEKLMLKNGYGYPYAKARNYLQLSDITAANLETPVTLRGTPAPNKQYVYKASPDALPALIDSGVDLVNLANNHTLDQGEVGLLDTIGYLNKVKLPNVGAGRNDAEAFKPVIKEANGIRVAYLGLTRVVPVGSWKAGPNHPGLAESYDPSRAVAAIKKAKAEADVVVVMVHWGTELADLPNADQKRLGHAYIDAGADLVVGSHPHVLQGFESYKGKWIAYSLGNFVFSGMPDKRTADTGVLDAACGAGGACSLAFHPMRAVQSQPAPLEGEEAAALLKRLAGISVHATVDANGLIHAKE